MTLSVEGLPILEPSSPHLHAWQLINAPRAITMRDGAAGFVLAFWADWFDENVERLDQPSEMGPHPTGIDDGGYAHRPITGGSTPTKHQTGGAEDLNWRKHPYNTPTLATFTAVQVKAIRDKLNDTVVAGHQVIEWGGNWPSHPGSTAKTDSMHFQISSQVEHDPIGACELLAKRWMKRPRGVALLAANPGQKAVILS